MSLGRKLERVANTPTRLVPPRSGGRTVFDHFAPSRWLSEKSQTSHRYEPARSSKTHSNSTPRTSVDVAPDTEAGLAGDAELREIRCLGMSYRLDVHGKHDSVGIYAGEKRINPLPCGRARQACARRVALPRIRCRLCGKQENYGGAAGFHRSPPACERALRQYMPSPAGSARLLVLLHELLRDIIRSLLIAIEFKRERTGATRERAEVPACTSRPRRRARAP